MCSTKRQLTPILSESSDDEQPPPKRRRIQRNDSYPKSERYSNYLDHCLYERIYKSLHNQLNIQPIIAKQIAEYANGQFKQCENYQNCNNKIAILHEHHSVYGTMDNSLLHYNQYIDKKTKTSQHKQLLFCNQCVPKLTKCKFNRGYGGDCNIPFIKQLSKETTSNVTFLCDCKQHTVFIGCYKHAQICKICKTYICNENGCSYHISSKCMQCESIICGDKDNLRKYCKKCCNYVCSKCIVLFDCKHDLHWKHGECNGGLKCCGQCQMIFCPEMVKTAGSLCRKCGGDI